LPADAPVRQSAGAPGLPDLSAAGGPVAIGVPAMPHRCPPGSHERAGLHGRSDGEYAVLPLGASPRYRTKEAENAEGWFKSTPADTAFA
jgi:hypothetical protein